MSSSEYSTLLTFTRTHLTARHGIREMQSTFCRAVRYHLDLQSHNCKLNRYHHHRRVAPLRYHDYVIWLQNGVCSPGSVTHACAYNTETKQSNTPTCADSLGVTSAGPVCYYPNMHAAEFLWRCVRKYTSQISQISSRIRSLSPFRLNSPQIPTTWSPHHTHTHTHANTHTFARARTNTRQSSRHNPKRSSNPLLTCA